MRPGFLKSALFSALTLGAISLTGAGVACAGQITFNFGTLPPTSSTGTSGTCSGTSSGCTYYGTATYGSNSYTLTASAQYYDSTSSSYKTASVTQAMS